MVNFKKKKTKIIQNYYDSTVENHITINFSESYSKGLNVDEYENLKHLLRQAGINREEDFKIAFNLVKEGKKEKAIRIYRKIKEEAIFSSKKELRNASLAVMYSGHLNSYSNPELALKNYREAVELNPKNLDAWNQISKILARLGYHNEELVQSYLNCSYQSAISKSPEEEAYSLMGLVEYHYSIREFDEANNLLVKVKFLTKQYKLIDLEVLILLFEARLVRSIEFNTKKTIKILEKAKKKIYSLKEENSKTKLLIIMDLSLYYMETNDLKKVEVNIFDAAKIAKEIFDYDNLILTYFSIGEFYEKSFFKNKNYNYLDMAQKYYYDAYRIATKISSKIPKLTASRMLLKLYRDNPGYLGCNYLGEESLENTIQTSYHIDINTNGTNRFESILKDSYELAKKSTFPQGDNIFFRIEYYLFVIEDNRGVKLVKEGVEYFTNKLESELHSIREYKIFPKLLLDLLILLLTVNKVNEFNYVSKKYKEFLTIYNEEYPLLAPKFKVLNAIYCIQNHNYTEAENYLNQAKKELIKFHKSFYLNYIGMKAEFMKVESIYIAMIEKIKKKYKVKKVTDKLYNEAIYSSTEMIKLVNELREYKERLLRRCSNLLYS